MTTEKTYTAAELAPLLNKQQPADIIQMWRDGKFPHAKLEGGVLRIPESDAKSFLDTAIAPPQASPDNTTAPQEVLPEEIPTEPPALPPVIAEESRSPIPEDGLGTLQEQADSIIADAHEQADAIIAAANEEANHNLEDSQNEATVTRSQADSYAANTRAVADKYAADKTKDADFYYGERHETADKYFDTKLSESTKSYEEAIASRKNIIAEMDKAIETRRAAIGKLSDSVKAIETQYRKIVGAAQKNQSYYYNLAQHDLWARFLDWARRMVQSSAK